MDARALLKHFWFKRGRSRRLASRVRGESDDSDDSDPSESRVGPSESGALDESRRVSTSQVSSHEDVRNYFGNPNTFIAVTSCIPLSFFFV